MRNSPNYNNAVVYKIFCKDPNFIEYYIGSSADIIKRKNNHKTACNNSNDPHYNIYLYKQIRENGGFQNFYFEILEQVSCKNKAELLLREMYYINLLKPTLNKHVNFGESDKCEHNKRKSDCVICLGGYLCEHLVRRVSCKICNPHICKHCGMYTNKYYVKKHEEKCKIKSQELN